MTEETIQAKLNQPFTINLGSLPTAGYKWTVEHDPSFLRTETQLNATIGGGSNESFTFIPKRLGETVVTATYKRPWEKDASDKRVFTIQISN